MAGAAVAARVYPKGEKYMKNSPAWDGAYFFSVVGAAVYFIQHAVGFWPGVLGIIKALVWPAFMVYKLLEFFKV
jgi:hypothetical protein